MRSNLHLYSCAHVVHCLTYKCRYIVYFNENIGLFSYGFLAIHKIFRNLPVLQLICTPWPWVVYSGVKDRGQWAVISIFFYYSLLLMWRETEAQLLLRVGLERLCWITRVFKATEQWPCRGKNGKQCVSQTKSPLLPLPLPLSLSLSKLYSPYLGMNWGYVRLCYSAAFNSYKLIVEYCLSLATNQSYKSAEADLIPAEQSMKQQRVFFIWKSSKELEKSC